MDFTGEIRLLCEAFHKCRTAALVLGSDELPLRIPDESFRLIFGTHGGILPQEPLPERAVCRLESDFLFRYLMLCLPDGEPSAKGGRVLVIGPYLSERPGQREILELAERWRVPPRLRDALNEYFESLPCLPEGSPLFVLVDCFAEQIYGTGRFTLADIRPPRQDGAGELAAARMNDAGETVLSMKRMEERYAAENELMLAVSRGQIHKATSLLSGFASASFKKRLDDPLRNLKNYSIIMNTLLRKAVEQGGVHPIYLDRMSSAFALRIEQAASEAAARSLMGDMVRSYCQLVRKHAMRDYSAPVRKALLMIDTDLAADLSLSRLADAQNINASYLSALFKKETGKTVTEYINGERMRLAMQLLEGSDWQIQTVALHCGIMDVHYFSRLFRRQTGMTPKDYRKLRAGG